MNNLHFERSCDGVSHHALPGIVSIVLISRLLALRGAGANSLVVNDIRCAPGEVFGVIRASALPPLFIKGSGVTAAFAAALLLLFLEAAGRNNARRILIRKCATW